MCAFGFFSKRSHMGQEGEKQMDGRSKGSIQSRSEKDFLLRFKYFIIQILLLHLNNILMDQQQNTQRKKAICSSFGVGSSRHAKRSILRLTFL